MSRKQITIIGLGLIGGSLAKALKKKKHYAIHGYARSETVIQKAEKSGVIEKGFTDIGNAVKNSDIIIFCTPLSSYVPLLEAALPHIKENTIISDVGSAKESVIQEITPLLSQQQQRYFAPAHPIAGAEKSGFTASKQTLFKGKRAIITPTATSHTEAVQTIRELWQHAGAYIEELSAKRHDAIYAAVSHTPQLLAFAYEHAVASLPETLSETINGCETETFKRFRRIGQSPTAMWDDIFTANRTAITHAIDKTCDTMMLSAQHFAERTQDFARNHASLNMIEHSTSLEDTHHTAYIYMHVLPVMLARALHSVSELYLPYAGTGFGDFTNMQHIPLTAQQIPALKKETLAILPRFIETIHSFKAGI